MTAKYTPVYLLYLLMRYALIILLFTTIVCKAQPSKFRAFTIADGLPSNNVYGCVEDKKGFLWVATDAGVARFDGRHFRVFTTHDGLPDNEVLEVKMEINGTIWANCFKQAPAYFDEVKNRFINATEDSGLKRLPQSNNVLLSFLLPDGGIMFTNNESYIIKNKQVTVYKAGKKGDKFFVRKNSDGSIVKVGSIRNVKTNRTAFKFYQIKANKYIDSTTVIITKPGDMFVLAIDGRKLYLFNRTFGTVLIYSYFKDNALAFKTDSIKLPEPFTSHGFTSDGIYLVGYSGKVILYDKKTLMHQYDISGSYLPNSAYKDRKGNLWICTIDKGLLFYENNRLGSVALPQALNSADFLSITAKPNGGVLAGSFYGAVVETKPNKVIVHQVPKNNVIARQRKILLAGGNVFTLSEAGSYINYSKLITITSNGSMMPGKTGIVYNDSVVLVGMTTGMRKLNSKTGENDTLNVFHKRITAMARNSRGDVYFGSTDGMYKHNYVNNTSVVLNNVASLQGERITGVCVTGDDLVWVTTAGQGIAVLKNDKLLLQINEGNGIVNNATRCITTGKPGEVWLGTGNGISRISYTHKNSRFRYSIMNITSTDGLTDNIINELAWARDTVYAATANGISIVPGDISVYKYNIPVHLVDVNINQRDTILASTYKLKYKQQNIQLQFAGVELGGHFKNLQYNLNKNKNWLSLYENSLALQLNSGKHILQVRAVDINGNKSDRILTLSFDIATPFWRSVWFWIASAFIAQLLIIYLINRRQKRRKEARLARQIASVQTAALEQQAFTSLMNPHFMFNALNSIQHYMNVQDRQSTNRYLSDFASLIRKNFEAAQRSFIPLEEELENIKIYLRLEQMRFSDRFSYSLTVGDDVDTDDWMIPTMILQPLLENALLHGIMPSSIPGELLISIKIKGTYLCIIIIDNGIGIANSMALKQDSSHKSRGTELINKRIAALSGFGKQAITIKISPAFDDEKNPGNKTELCIPEGLYKAWLAAQQQ